MSDTRPSWLETRWARLSSGPKLLLMMSFALLPLGLIAIAASIYNARENSAQRAEQTLARLEDKAEAIDELIARTASTMRAAGAAVAAAPPSSPICERVLARLAAEEAAPGRFALFGASGEMRCATDGFRPPTPLRIDRSGLDIVVHPERLQLIIFSDSGTVEAVAEYSREALRDLTFLPGTSANFDLSLSDGEDAIVLRDDYRPVPLSGAVSDRARVAQGRMELQIRLDSAPVQASDILLILLPVMMWIGAGLVGWWTVNRQLLRPLASIRNAVSNYRPGDRPMDLPKLASPAMEIEDLGEAFDHATRTVARHEAELEAAVERQTRLVREVHHRVKNNLQVVASLLNLHSRASRSEDAAAAYASIQRRVDALAVVHRNHYAELEENRGVSLKPLVSELAANLRATAPASASSMQIRLDIAPFHVNQDVAVSVAFLVTEITEYAMLSGSRLVSVVLDDAEAGSARLAIEADALADGSPHDPALAERFERIITGLARQLRSPLERIPERGSYAVRIGIVDRHD